MPAVETLQETRNADGSWHGPGKFPDETTKYFTWGFKGHSNAHAPSKNVDSGYTVSPLLLDHIANNEPALTALDISGRGLKDDQMYAIIEALKKNTTVRSRAPRQSAPTPSAASHPFPTPTPPPRVTAHTHSDLAVHVSPRRPRVTRAVSTCHSRGLHVADHGARLLAQPVRPGGDRPVRMAQDE